MNIEQDIQAKGLIALRVTPADIEANIVSEHYFRADEAIFGAETNPMEDHPKSGVKLGDQPFVLLTFCVLRLRNGFLVTGESACASPENFDAEIGRKIARQNAVSKMWALMGYELKSKLAVAPEVAA